MKRTLAVLVTLSLGATVLLFSAPAPAWGGGVVVHPGPHFHPGHFQHGHFHHGGCCFFGGFAAGVFTGAVVGAAFAPVYAYPAPVYAAPPPPTYWYYCRSAGAYYPYVPSCPEPWVPVPAQ